MAAGLPGRFGRRLSAVAAICSAVGLAAMHNVVWGRDADLISIATRNVVAVYDRDKPASHLGSAVLLDRDRAIAQCRMLKGANKVGIRQGARRSAVRIENPAVKDLCELRIVRPVHFDPLPIGARRLESISSGDMVYAAAAPPGRDVSLISARVAHVTRNGDDKLVRLDGTLPATHTGSALFDRSGALIGVAARGGKAVQQSVFIYPDAYLPSNEGAIQVVEPAAGLTKTALQIDPAPNSEPLARGRDTAVPDGGHPTADAEKAGYKQAMTEYLAKVVSFSTRHVNYPDEARRARWAGTAFIWFRLNTGGEYRESFVDTTSGYATLDVEALLAVRKAIDQLPLPPVIQERGMMGTVAVTFALAER
jgi:TonB family protein